MIISTLLILSIVIIRSPENPVRLENAELFFQPFLITVEMQTPVLKIGCVTNGIEILNWLKGISVRILPQHIGFLCQHKVAWLKYICLKLNCVEHCFYCCKVLLRYSWLVVMILALFTYHLMKALLTAQLLFFLKQHVYKIYIYPTPPYE